MSAAELIAEARLPQGATRRRLEYIALDLADELEKEQARTSEALASLRSTPAGFRSRFWDRTHEILTRTPASKTLKLVG